MHAFLTYFSGSSFDGSFFGAARPSAAIAETSGCLAAIFSFSIGRVISQAFVCHFTLRFTVIEQTVKCFFEKSRDCKKICSKRHIKKFFFAENERVKCAFTVACFFQHA